MSLPRLGHDPREGRDANVSPAIEWIPTLGCWCVFETKVITAILKSADFVAADFAEWHRSLGKIGIDCSSVIEILDYVAIANEGNHHAEIRRNMARVIAAKATSCKEAAGRKVTELPICSSASIRRCSKAECGSRREGRVRHDLSRRSILASRKSVNGSEQPRYGR